MQTFSQNALYCWGVFILKSTVFILDCKLCLYVFKNKTKQKKNLEASKLLPLSNLGKFLPLNADKQRCTISSCLENHVLHALFYLLEYII